VIFDRSWYNRAGVERVTGFVNEKEAEPFLSVCPKIEKHIIDAGIILIKFWLEVGQEEQEKRFSARINDPLSTVEIESDGSGIIQPMVQLFVRPRRYVEGHRYRLRAVAHCEIG
jgi:hypothetical protein